MKIRSIIFGSLQEGFIDVHIGYGYGGINSGGGLSKVKRELIPKDCRMPNTYVWAFMEKGEVMEIRKMSQEEIKINKNEQNELD